MSYDIGVRLGVDGEKAFRSSIDAINANIKSMGSELKAVTAQFAKNAASEEALTAKNQVLAKSISATKEKISVLDKQLERQAEKLRELGQAPLYHRKAAGNCQRYCWGNQRQRAENFGGGHAYRCNAWKWPNSSDSVPIKKPSPNCPCNCGCIFRL
nr:hypothetical protein [uncultured Oscillibacter sp.]